MATASWACEPITIGRLSIGHLWPGESDGIVIFAPNVRGLGSARLSMRWLANNAG